MDHAAIGQDEAAGGRGTSLRRHAADFFGKGGVWETPWMERVLPVIASIAGSFRSAPFSRASSHRKIPRIVLDNGRPITGVGRPQRAPGLFSRTTRPGSDSYRFVPPANVIDKPAYSAFFSSGLDAFLQRNRSRSVVVTGAEPTSACSSTVLGAVDRGLRVVIVEDALCSSSDEGHEALMTMYRTRLQEQIELITADRFADVWTPE